MNFHTLQVHIVMILLSDYFNTDLYTLELLVIMWSYILQLCVKVDALLVAYEWVLASSYLSQSHWVKLLT